MERNWRCGEKSYYFDVSEVGCMRRLSESLTALQEKEQTEHEPRPAHVALAAFCESIEAFFTGVFGPAASAEICGEVQSGNSYAEKFLDFVRFAKNQAAEVESAIAAAEAAYYDNAVDMGVIA